MKLPSPAYSCAAPRMAVAVALLSLSFPAFPQESPTTRSALAEIVETRDRCAEYASIAKHELKADRLTKAHMLYAEAYSSNSAWVATVKTAIREGRAKNLATDKLYEQVSSKAAGASKDFAEYVKSQTAPNPATSASARGATAGTVGFASPVLLICPLADLGVKIWKAHSDKVTADRVSAAEGFSKDASWKAWDDLGSSRPGPGF